MLEYGTIDGPLVEAGRDNDFSVPIFVTRNYRQSGSTFVFRWPYHRLVIDRICQSRSLDRTLTPNRLQGSLRWRRWSGRNGRWRWREGLT